MMNYYEVPTMVSVIQSLESSLYPPYEINVQDIDDKGLNDHQLEILWSMFGDVAINDLDEILDDFLVWNSGTDRFLIWKWFDMHHSKGVAFLAGALEEESEGCE